MVFDLEHAKQFLEATSLPTAPEVLGISDGMGMPELETSKQQSLVVGANVVSFTTGVEADVRQAITDSSLFAQLAAAKAVGTNTDGVLRCVFRQPSCDRLGDPEQGDCRILLQG